MKKTKRIEVTICDSCGAETHATKCARCGIDVCSECKMDLYKVRSPYMMAEYSMGGSYGSQYEFLTSLCKKCYCDTIKELQKKID